MNTDIDDLTAGIPLNTPEYWDLAYIDIKHGENPRFDNGQVIPAVKQYFAQATDSPNNIDITSNILIPGAGNAYEAEYLHLQGYENVYVVDFAPTPLANFRKRLPNFPNEKIIQVDFFSLIANYPDFLNHFDYVIEKAFFCAITPDLRQDYVSIMYQLLKPKAMLFGVFVIGETKQNQEYVNRPPFACSLQEYASLFDEKFDWAVVGSKEEQSLLRMIRKETEHPIV